MKTPMTLTKARLQKLVDKGMTDEKIGEPYGITRQAVFQKRQKFGIVARTEKNKERNKEMRKLHKKGKGMTGMAIAKKFNMSTSQVYRIINER